MKKTARPVPSKLAVSAPPVSVAVDSSAAIPLSELGAGDSDSLDRFEDMRREDDAARAAEVVAASPSSRGVSDDDLVHVDCVYMTRDHQRTHVNLNSVDTMQALGWALEKSSAKSKKGR